MNEELQPPPYPNDDGHLEFILGTFIFALVAGLHIFGRRR